MKVVTGGEMRWLEETAEKEYGLGSLILMENAGKEAAIFITDLLKASKNKRVTIFAGKGNNAGDGFVAARHLFNNGIHVRLILLNKPEEFSPNAAVNYRILQNMGVRIQSLSSERDLQTVKIGLLYTDIIVDAIFGTGFKGAPSYFLNKVFNVINNAMLPVVALDIPSGVNADTGSVEDVAIKASYTLAMGLPKLGTVNNVGSEYAGSLSTLNITLPNKLLNHKKLRRNLATLALCRAIKPNREIDSHKGTFGHVVVIGGSENMVGAPCLAAAGAARNGCGLVTLALPKTFQMQVASLYPFLLTFGLTETSENSAIALAALKDLQAHPRNVQAMVLGPGLSRHPEALQFVREAITTAKVPLVIDADGLFALKGQLDILKKLEVPVVLTPHPGEMSYLTGQSVEDIQKDRIHIAESFSKEYNVTLVLKGYRTIIADATGETYIISNGNSGMAKGGSGDVLAGMIGSLLAQDMKAPAAAVLAAYLHGLSGDICAQKLSKHAMLAQDIIENIPYAWQKIEDNRGDI